MKAIPMPGFATHAKVTALLFSASSSHRIASVLSLPSDDPVQRTCHSLGGQREVDLDPQSFAVGVIDHVEQTDAVPIG